MSVEYFMDRMQEYEISTFIENIPFLDVNSWEQTRQLLYVYAQSMSRKQLKPTDLLSFKWDVCEKKNTSISNADIDRLRNRAKSIEKQIKTNNGE